MEHQLKQMTQQRLRHGYNSFSTIKNLLIFFKTQRFKTFFAIESKFYILQNIQFTAANAKISAVNTDRYFPFSD